MVGLSTTELSELFGTTPQAIHHWKVNKEPPIESKKINGKNFFEAPDVRKFLQDKAVIFFKKIILVNSLKGGPGKTTIALALSNCFACLGAKVLLIDLDKQGNATNVALSGNLDKVKYIFYDVIRQESPIPVAQTITQTDHGFDLIPSTLFNSRCDMELSSKRVNNETFFKSLLEPIINDYEYIVIDTAPDISYTVYFASMLADEIIIPICLDRFSLDGLELNLKNLSDISGEFHNFSPKIRIVINKFDARETSALRFLGEVDRLIQEYKGGGSIILSETFIRISSDFRRSHALREPLKKGGGKNTASADMYTLAKEVLNIASKKEDAVQ